MDWTCEDKKKKEKKIINQIEYTLPKTAVIISEYALFACSFTVISYYRMRSV